jgi:DNA-binding NtrC family response regulator
VILCKGPIEASHLNLDRPGEGSQPESAGLNELEREAIREALLKTGGNRKRAAELLGISRRTLHYRLKEYGITKE